MGECLAFRKRINELPENKVAMSDLRIKAVSKSLQKYPNINASLHDDRQRMFQKILKAGEELNGEQAVDKPMIDG